MQSATKQLNKSEAYRKARQLIHMAIADEETPTPKFVGYRFKAEYGYKANYHRYGSRRIVIREWLKGLALNVPFYTFDIEAMGFEDGDRSGQYWYELARAFEDICFKGLRG